VCSGLSQRSPSGRFAHARQLVGDTANVQHRIRRGKRRLLSRNARYFIVILSRNMLRHVVESSFRGDSRQFPLHAREFLGLGTSDGPCEVVDLSLPLSDHQRCSTLSKISRSRPTWATARVNSHTNRIASRLNSSTHRHHLTSAMLTSDFTIVLLGCLTK
jgi:hypothetical protein